MPRNTDLTSWQLVLGLLTGVSGYLTLNDRVLGVLTVFGFWSYSLLTVGPNLERGATHSAVAEQHEGEDN